MNINSRLNVCESIQESDRELEHRRIARSRWARQSNIPRGASGRNRNSITDSDILLLFNLGYAGNRAVQIVGRSLGWGCRCFGVLRLSTIKRAR